MGSMADTMSTMGVMAYAMTSMAAANSDRQWSDDHHLTAYRYRLAT